MSVFSGPQPGEKTDRGPSRKRGPKGAMRMHRQLLHEEAVARAEKKKGKKDVPVEPAEATVPEAGKPRKRRRRKVSGERNNSVDGRDS